jgi:hypothetical protein
MNKLKLLVSGLGVAVFAISSSLGQNQFDALRYSQIDVAGTARFSAMGGAFGALGGDMSSMTVNPAGIGVFTRTTGSATLGILSVGTDATYLGIESSDLKMNANIGNVGFVARFKRKRGQDKQWAWKAFHVGVSYNRTANFHRRTSIVGVNESSSLVDGWVNQLNTKPEPINYADIPTELTPGAEFSNAYLGWGTFLIDTMPGSVNSYMRNFAPSNGQTQQVRETTKGSMGEMALSFGGNFGNALYVGATIGIPRLSYEVERTYSESDTQDTITNFRSFSRTDFLRATGNGLNIKFGMIYRPAKWLRLGAAFHSPTWFAIDEEFTTSLTSDLETAGQYTLATVNGAFDYRLQTPFRAIGSLAFVIGKIGLISADYEYVNYSLAQLNSRSYSFDSENADVKSQLHWAGNIRVGTEWRIKSFSVRGGFAINGDPYSGGYNFDNTRYSLGAGFRFKRFFVDMSYNLHRLVNSYELYDAAIAETLTIQHSVITTVGFRF